MESRLVLICKINLSDYIENKNMVSLLQIVRFKEIMKTKVHYLQQFITHLIVHNIIIKIC